MAKEKQARAQSAEKPGKQPPVRVGYTIAHAADRRVKAASLHTGRTQSEIVEEAILKAVPGYYVTVRGANGDGEAGEPLTEA